MANFNPRFTMIGRSSLARFGLRGLGKCAFAARRGAGRAWRTGAAFSSSDARARASGLGAGAVALCAAAAACTLFPHPASCEKSGGVGVETEPYTSAEFPRSLGNRQALLVSGGESWARSKTT